MIRLTGDIPHVTSDRTRKGGRQLRRPILPAPPPRFRPFKPLVQNDPPPLTVDTTIFEMWLGSLSTHQDLSIPVV